MRAYVTSIETIGEFRTALCEFAADTKDSLSGIEMQIRRAFDWLNNQMKSWQREIRVRQEELVRAKIELTSRKFANRDGKGAGTTDQEKAFRKAQARLKEAEQKLVNCRRWLPALQQAITEYHGPARQLSGTLDSDLKHAVAILDQKLGALEAYLGTAPPAAPVLDADFGAETELAPTTTPTSVSTQPPEPVSDPAPSAGTKERGGEDAGNDKAEASREPK